MEEALKDLYRDHKPQEVTELERKYFNKEMPKEWQELIQDFPQLKAQWMANYLKDKDTFTRWVEYRKEELLEKFKDKPFAKTDSEFFNLKREGFYGLLSPEVKDRLGFKHGGFSPDEMPAIQAQNKKAERALRFMLKKGDIEDLATELTKGGV